MKRYLKYILLALISVALAVSCIEELEPTPSMTANDEVAVLVPRIKSFTNQYVTRSDYSEAEMTISSLKVLVFNNDGRLVHHDDIPVDSRTISLNKSMLNSAYGELTNATVVMLANMDLSRLKKDNTPLSSNLSNLKLSDLENYSYSHEQSVYTSLPSGFKGFPMIGGTTGVDLSPTSSSNPQKPVIVDLKILYAKVNFEISVEQGGENQRVDPNNTQQMQFQLDKYAVYNASAVTALAIPTTEGEPVRDFLGNIPNAENIASVDEPTLSSTYSYTSGSGATLNIGKTVALGGASIPFTFYIAESRYNHNLASLEGIYPDSEWLAPAPNDDVKGWNTLTDEQKKLQQNKLNGVKYLYDDLIQQYKPKLANVGGGLPGPGLASFVRLTGKYTDYRGTVWNVNYDVYLGKDNSQNFHVDRNSEYTNIITIKGLRNNDSYGEEQVWFDHRVDVSLGSGQGADDCVTITRETLIDAHIEVRPMRVKWKEGEYAGVRVYLPTKDGTLVNWIGIERFTGANCQDSATYCYADGESTGKRRYFTTDLISELQTKEGEFGVQEDTDGNKFIYLQNGDCAWIYFDEHVSFTNSTTPSSARDAVIKLEFFGDDGNKKAEEIYNVKQLGLQRRGGYNVESYEEYLHSYDSADKYNLSTTPADYTQQGLAWGLADKVVSQDIIVSRATIGSDIIKNLADSWFPDAKYDFFADGDSDLLGDSFYRYMKENGVWSSKSGDKETGLGFTNRATKNKIITVKDMGSAPENAYQYCLSKNKFEVDDDGNVKMVLNWYLPDVHQLAKVLNATAEGSSDFRSDDFYWSSQPSFTADDTYQWGTTSFGLLDEVPEKARARSKGGNPKDFPRSSKNRIRCLYATKGQEADMTGRTPDGIGGNYSFLMKGNLESGYFHNLLQGKRKDIPEDIETDYLYDDSSFAYPTKANSYGVTGAEFGYEVDKDKNNNPIEGFVEDPQANWNEYVLELGSLGGDYPTGYYTTLGTYPGLSEYKLEKFGREFLNTTIDLGLLGKYTIEQIASRLGVNLEDWLSTEAYKPTETKRMDTQTLTSSSIIDLRTEDLPQNANLQPLNDKLKISFSAANSEGNKPDFEYYELLSSTKQTNTRYWIPPSYKKTDHPMTESQVTVSASGTDSADGSALGTIAGGSLNAAKQNAFEGSLSNGWNGAYSKAKAKALQNLKNTISANSNYSSYTFNESDVVYTQLEWNSPEPAVKYTNTSEKWSGCKATCTVTLTASVVLKKSATLSLYTQTSGTGCWGEPVVGNKESAGAEVTTDEFRMYGGNSFTITCTDPEYEITKVKIYYEGSSQISQSGLTTYYARFVDSETAADLPIVGDETDHLRGMEYSESDGWQQWSGTGSDSVTMVLADYMIQAYYENWWEILTGVKYNYEYQVPSSGLSKYLVINRIEVKCTKKATASE